MRGGLSSAGPERFGPRAITPMRQLSGLVAHAVAVVTIPRSLSDSRPTISCAMSSACSLREFSAAGSPPEASRKGVMTSLGFTCMTRMLNLRSSARHTSVRPVSANLVDE